MKYKIVKDSSLRKSMHKYKEEGDERWKLFDALLSSSTFDEYIAKVHGFEQVMVSRVSGKPWYITPANHFGYELKIKRIEKIN